MIRLIISGMDGALVPNESPDLDLEASDVILRLRERGMQFVVISGHPWASVESALEPVKKKIFYVANNGVHVGCHDRRLYTYIMDRQLVHRIIWKVRIHPELEMVYAGANGDYPGSKSGALYDWLTNGYKFNVIRVRDVLEPEELCMKISTYEKEGIETAVRDIYEEFGDQTKVARAGDVWMGCMARNMNEDRVMCVIQESLGTKVEKIMAFGNQPNDVEMPNQAYYSFVVASAREEICRAARSQADSDVWDGVLKILKGLL